uniref:CSON010551 protein n=1 Tax=Culicoides sonorensis TaxID=179676 RepID=A0A336N238_CULSO
MKQYNFVPAALTSSSSTSPGTKKSSVKSSITANNNNNNHSSSSSSKMLRSPAHIVGPPNGAGGMMGLHQTPPPHARTSLFDSCHRKIRFIGSSPFALFGTLVA